MPPDPADALRGLRTAIGQIADSGPLAPLLGPLQRQADLIEDLVRRQVEFERDLLGRALAPATAVLDILDQTAGAMRKQAQAFNAASVAFKQAADMLEVQANLMETAASTVRDPGAVVKSAGRTASRAARSRRSSPS